MSWIKRPMGARRSAWVRWMEVLGVWAGTAANVVAQDVTPGYDVAFLQDEVTTVRLTLDPDDLAFILHPDNAYSNEEFPGTFVHESSLGMDTVANVGIRLRGNTSRTSGKKSFKVSFNTFVAGQQWSDLDKLNLNGEHNDPSILRARMTWEFMRSQGLVAPRVSHVKLITHLNKLFPLIYCRCI